MVGGAEQTYGALFMLFYKTAVLPSDFGLRKSSPSNSFWHIFFPVVFLLSALILAPIATPQFIMCSQFSDSRCTAGDRRGESQNKRTNCDGKCFFSVGQWGGFLLSDSAAT